MNYQLRNALFSLLRTLLGVAFFSQGATNSLFYGEATLGLGLLVANILGLERCGLTRLRMESIQDAWRDNSEPSCPCLCTCR